jgi:hypothetical protein
MVFGDAMNHFFPVCGFIAGAGVFLGIFQPFLGWFGLQKSPRLSGVSRPDWFISACRSWIVHASRRSVT